MNKEKCSNCLTIKPWNGLWICAVRACVRHHHPTWLIKLLFCNSFGRWNGQSGRQTNHVFSCCLYNFLGLLTLAGYLSSSYVTVHCCTFRNCMESWMQHIAILIQFDKTQYQKTWQRFCHRFLRFHFMDKALNCCNLLFSVWFTHVFILFVFPIQMYSILVKVQNFHIISQCLCEQGWGLALEKLVFRNNKKLLLF